MLKVGIDISPLRKVRTGVGNYCYYLLKHLAAAKADCQMIGFSSGLRIAEPAELSTAIASHRHVGVPTRGLYMLWELLGAPKVDTLLHGVDVFHATNFFLPPTRTAKRIVTIHDLSFLVKPELCSPKIVGPYSRGIRTFARDADAILAYSESTKRDIVRLLDVREDKIVVAPLAVDNSFRSPGSYESKTLVSEKYGLRAPYILFVSTLEPRKNAPGVISAFDRLAREFPHQLVLVGARGWKTESIDKAMATSPFRDRIIELGYLQSHLDLPAIYGAADALLFPSFYEGFGLPILEAFACGCPVVCSDNSSLPEVAGDAALMGPADDVDALANHLRRILTEPALRSSLIESGYRQVSRFSWAATAAKTLDTYRSVA